MAMQKWVEVAKLNKYRTPDQFPHFGSPTSQGLSPRINIACYRAMTTSRRQYLSRMDRCQHGRSGANFRTMRGVDQSKTTGL